MMSNVTQSLSSRTENSVSIKWTSDAVIDYLWYSTNNGVAWTAVNIANGKSGIYTIRGLNANATYTVKTRVRRFVDHVSVYSAALTVTTYAYPFSNSMPSFVIGETLTIGIFNPLSRPVTVALLGANGAVVTQKTTSGTSVSGFTDSDTVNRLLKTIPNTKSGRYSVRVTYAKTSATNQGGMYTISAGTVPKIGSVSYTDLNTATKAITGNNQLIIRNKSLVRFNAAGLKAGTGATISKCTVNIMDVAHDMTIVDTTAYGGDLQIDSASDIIATVTVTDSRGMTAFIAVQVHIIDWFLPTSIIDINRHNNYYSETDINVNADFAGMDGLNNLSIQFRYKKVGASTYSQYITLQDDVTYTIALDNKFRWNIQILLTDIFGSTTYNAVLPMGMPIVFFDTQKQSTGFNCFPQHENSVEINGYDLMVHSGDTLTLQDIITSGCLTNAGKSIRFTVILPKYVVGLSISVTDLRLNIRIASGGYALSAAYVNDGYDVLSDSDITVTAVLRTANAISFTLEKSSAAFNGINNTPVDVQINSLELSFTGA